MNNLSILKNKNFYPECYIPEMLSIPLEGNLDLLIEKNRPRFNEKEPIPPTPPEEPNLKEMVLLIPASIALVFSFNVFLIIIFLIIAAITFRYIKAIKLYPKLIEKYHCEISFYEDSINSYKQMVDGFKIQCQQYDLNLASHKFLNSLIRKEIKETFDSSPEPSVFAPSPQKGRSENFFKRYLIKYFGQAIRDDCTIEMFQYKKKIDFDFDFLEYGDDYIDITNCYVPDFCFIHPSKSLKIDIEIDEPYTHKKQIHYTTSDNRRNRYFIDKNWIVLRFSEQQIEKAPTECCREIAEIIYYFTNDVSYINNLLDTNRLKRLKKWTFEDSTKLIANNHRQHYSEIITDSVTINLINGLWEDEEVSYEFVGTIVKKVLKRKSVVRSSWKIYNGIFCLNKDKIKGYFIEILWETNQTEYLALDHLVKDRLVITNIYTRSICFLSSTNSSEKIPLNVYYDESLKKTYTIDEIKQIFGYQTISFDRAYTKKQKTEYLISLDEEKHIIFMMHQDLLIKLNSDRTYDQIKLNRPDFVKFSKRNVIKIELIDKDE